MTISEYADPRNLPHGPSAPDEYDPNIGFVGCGGISEAMLRSYKHGNYDVTALCDIDYDRAELRREQFYGDADTYTDYHDVLADDDIDVVVLAAHPKQREPMIRDALNAGKHVHSQKPFVVDLDVGEELVELADENDVKLSVHQPARWEPQYRYITSAVDQGLLGDVVGAHIATQFDHNWITDTPFDDVEHVILYDWAIHKFDLLARLTRGNDPERVFASTGFSPGQHASPPLLGQASVEFENAQATIVCDGSTPEGHEDRTYVAGTEGSVTTMKEPGEDHQVTCYLDDAEVEPALDREPHAGFHGALGELLAAIEADREPENSARDNLRSLELCFAAVASAEDNEPKVPGEVRGMRGEMK